MNPKRANRPFGLDHIDLRVSDMAAARPFYAAFLPALGFTKDTSVDKWFSLQAERRGDESDEFIGIIESAQHVPNETRLAFWAPSTADVDRLAEVVRQAGARNIEGPRLRRRTWLLRSLLRRPVR